MASTLHFFKELAGSSVYENFENCGRSSSKVASTLAMEEKTRGRSKVRECTNDIKKHNFQKKRNQKISK